MTIPFPTSAMSLFKHHTNRTRKEALSLLSLTEMVSKSEISDKHTGSPFIRVFKGEGQAVVNCCNLDAGVLNVLCPFCILQHEGKED